MIRVTLEIDNNRAYSCSPLEFVRKYILQDAKNKRVLCGIKLGGKFDYEFDTPHGDIKVVKIEQI